MSEAKTKSMVKHGRRHISQKGSALCSPTASQMNTPATMSVSEVPAKQRVKLTNTNKINNTYQLKKYLVLR